MAAQRRRQTDVIMALLSRNVLIKKVPGVRIHDSETIWDVRALLLGSG